MLCSRLGDAGLVILLVLAACGGESDDDADVRSLLRLPERFAVPAIPEYNPLTREKIALGRRLFYDTQLSANGTQACASCHLQSRAFADTSTTPLGSTGTRLRRNAQGLANVAYAPTLTWANDALVVLEDQIHVPLTGDNPIELGVTDAHRDEVLQRFRDDPSYADAFLRAFPETGGTVSLNAIAFALASFCRTIISGSSDYDRYAGGDTTALTAQQLRGLRLFNSERLECFHCHSGQLFTIAYRDANSADDAATRAFFNTGLYDVDGTGSYPTLNQGLYELTQQPRDRGLFRPPSLRNVALTAPYMHDGSVATLREVIAIYARGGRRVAEGPWAGDGATSPLKSGLIRGFNLSADETDDVVAFLESLSDVSLTLDPELAAP